MNQQQYRPAHVDAQGHHERSVPLALTERLRDAEAELDELRSTTENLEREVAVMRADLVRLRFESERAAGSRLP